MVLPGLHQSLALMRPLFCLPAACCRWKQMTTDERRAYLLAVQSFYG